MIRKLLLISVLILLTLSNALGQSAAKKFLKYSTFYASFSQSNSMVQESMYAVRDGVLTTLPTQNLPNYTLSVGLRKLARFGYENKARAFYDGSEVSMTEEANVGNVSGFEYVFEYSNARLTNREAKSQRYFIRHLSKFFVSEIDFMQDELSDIKYLETALKLRLKVGKKLNFTAGVAWRRHPAYGVDPITDWMSTNDGAWWLLAYDYGYTDQWTYMDSNDNDIYDSGEWGDWEWYGPEGNLVAETDSEFRRYRYGNIVNQYNRDVKRSLPQQYQFSAAVGLDFYHYSKDFWLHAWGNVMPYHKELGAYEYSYGRLHGDQWVDYNVGVIFGAKIGKNFGIFTEGKYSEYWGRPFGSATMGINYVIL